MVRTASKVEIGVMTTIIGAVVWVLSHTLPTEARVNLHDKEILSANAKLDRLLEQTNYMRGILDEMRKELKKVGGED